MVAAVELNHHARDVVNRFALVVPAALRLVAEALTRLLDSLGLDDHAHGIVRRDAVPNAIRSLPKCQPWKHHVLGNGERNR